METSFSGVVASLIYTDIDECQRNEDECHEEAECKDTIGSYNCTCNAGYTGDGFNCTGQHIHIFIIRWNLSFCTDIDECDEMLHDCHVFAECINFPGFYNCSCLENFEGNGTFCSELSYCNLRATTLCTHTQTKLPTIWRQSMSLL